MTDVPPAVLTRLGPLTGDVRGDLGNDLPEQHAPVAARLGFYRYSYGFMSSFSDSAVKEFALPAWLFVVVFRILPATQLTVAFRRRLRRRAGRCPRCNYDLRASIERCPECGTVIG